MNQFFPGAQTAAFQLVGSIGRGQDGAIANGCLFHFDANGTCNVYSFADQQFISSFTLGGAEKMVPHSNAVSFGCEFYAEGDEFPLLYSNVYNNYQKAENRHEGTCCVYRITRDGDQFAAELVQLIVIDFVNDAELWKSKNVQDIRPYGNFVVDKVNRMMYAFVMRDEAHQTRFFKFRLPTLADGEVARIKAEDILDQFDAEYVDFMQGATYHDGYIYSVEGFHVDSGKVPALRVFDVNAGKQVLRQELAPLGLTRETEWIEVYENKLYYADCEGDLYEVTFQA